MITGSHINLFPLGKKKNITKPLTQIKKKSITMHSGGPNQTSLHPMKLTHLLFDAVTSEHILHVIEEVTNGVHVI